MGFLAKRYLCCCFKEDKEKKRIYDYVSRYIEERLDIVFYLKTLEKFDRMRGVLFNTYQNLAFDFLKIPNLKNQKELESMDLKMNRDEDKDFAELAKYFEIKIKDKQLDFHDEQILKMIKLE